MRVGKTLPPLVVDELRPALFLAPGQRHPAGRVLRTVGDACLLELVASRARGAP